MKRIQSVRRKRRSGGATVTAAIAGFAVVCGLLLLIFGQAPSCSAGGMERQAIANQVLAALRATQKADRALETRNYGEARRLVQRAQTKLTRALSKIQDTGGR